MPQGLQCFDENGNIILDVTGRITRVLGRFNTGTSPGSLVDPNLLAGTPWYFTQIPSSSVRDSCRQCVVSFQGDTLSWTFSVTNTQGVSTYNVPYIVTYGVY
jgi:hypothetical protein